MLEVLLKKVSSGNRVPFTDYVQRNRCPHSWSYLSHSRYFWM